MSLEPAYFVLDQASVILDGCAVVDRVSLRIERNEHVCLLGPSGAGKTTLLRVLGATQRPHSGSVSVGGVSFNDASAESLRLIRSRVGFVHQDHGLVPNLRVSQNVLAGKLATLGFWGSLRSMLFPVRSDLEAVHAVLESVGIDELLFKRTDRLSGGERQRVALARALFQDPDALLADEPVASVDPVRARKLLELLISCANQRSMPLVVSLHNPELALEYFGRAIGIRAGRVVFDLSTEELESARLNELYRPEASLDR